VTPGHQAPDDVANPEGNDKEQNRQGIGRDHPPDAAGLHALRQGQPGLVIEVHPRGYRRGSVLLVAAPDRLRVLGWVRCHRPRFPGAWPCDDSSADDAQRSFRRKARSFVPPCDRDRFDLWKFAGRQLGLDQLLTRKMVSYGRGNARRSVSGAGFAAVCAGAHDRGIRPAQRSRRPDPRVDRRPDGRVKRRSHGLASPLPHFCCAASGAARLARGPVRTANKSLR
jgi:hypothetical protein